MRPSSRPCTSSSIALPTITRVSGSREAEEVQACRLASRDRACSTAAAAGPTHVRSWSLRQTFALESSFPTIKCTRKGDRRAAAAITHRDKEMFKKATIQHCVKTVNGKRVANTTKAMGTTRAPCNISIPIGKRKTPKCSIGNPLIIMSKGRWSASQSTPIIMTQSMIISRRITTHTPTTRTRCRWWRDLQSTSTLMGANQCRVSATAISRETAPCIAATPSPH
jgi:hypothetical protein